LVRHFSVNNIPALDFSYYAWYFSSSVRQGSGKAHLYLQLLHQTRLLLVKAAPLKSPYQVTGD